MERHHSLWQHKLGRMASCYYNMAPTLLSWTKLSTQPCGLRPVQASPGLQLRTWSLAVLIWLTKKGRKSRRPWLAHVGAHMPKMHKSWLRMVLILPLRTTTVSLATQFTTHLNPGQNPVRTPRSVGTVHQWTGTQEKLLGVLKVLVDAKVNLNIYDFEGFTPLLNLLRFQKNQWGVPSQAEAFSRASQANANFLVWSGANPNMASKQGAITPLAFCAYNGYPSTAALLLQKGANRYARNQWGKTPAELCGVGAGQVEVKQLLR